MKNCGGLGKLKQRCISQRCSNSKLRATKDHLKTHAMRLGKPMCKKLQGKVLVRRKAAAKKVQDKVPVRRKTIHKKKWLACQPYVAHPNQVTVEQCCMYYNLKDYPILVHESLKEKFKDYKKFEE